MLKKLFFLLCLIFIHSIAMAKDIPLGAGDTIKISVYGSEDLNLETKISEDGVISFPLIGNVEVKSLSEAEASAKIANLLKKGGYIVNPQVNIIVTSPQSRLITVVGQVLKPGRYPLDGKRNVADVIALAGGVSADGGDKVTIIHSVNNSTVRETFDLNELIHDVNNKALPEVNPSDVVYVERAEKFYIYGEVQRPGMYKLDKDVTMLQAISIGGGLTVRGTERGIVVRRKSKSGNVEETSVKKDDFIHPDDIIYIKESLF